MRSACDPGEIVCELLRRKAHTVSWEPLRTSDSAPVRLAFQSARQISCQHFLLGKLGASVQHCTSYSSDRNTHSGLVTSLHPITLMGDCQSPGVGVMLLHAGRRRELRVRSGARRRRPHPHRSDLQGLRRFGNRFRRRRIAEKVESSPRLRQTQFGLPSEISIRNACSKERPIAAICISP
jgi:hypothetical protein